MMHKDPSSKYRHFKTVDLPGRQLPANVQVLSPTLCSVDNGPLVALVDAFAQRGIHFDIADYHEHATRDGPQAEAQAYVEVRVGNQLLFWAARDGNSLLVSLKAVTSAVNRATRLGLLSVVSAAVAF